MEMNEILFVFSIDENRNSCFFFVHFASNLPVFFRLYTRDDVESKLRGWRVSMVFWKEGKRRRERVVILRKGEKETTRWGGVKWEEYLMSRGLFKRGTDGDGDDEAS